jgi:hypothetical protein
VKIRVLPEIRNSVEVCWIILEGKCTDWRTIVTTFFLIRIVGGGVQTGSTRHVGHWMAYCNCPGWLWWWRIWWNEDRQGNPKYSEKTCPSATLSTTNPTWPDPGLNPRRRGGKPATNRLSYGAAITTTCSCSNLIRTKCKELTNDSTGQHAANEENLLLKPFPFFYMSCEAENFWDQ